jgi:hypothetical protein
MNRKRILKKICLKEIKLYYIYIINIKHLIYFVIIY